VETTTLPAGKPPAAVSANDFGWLQIGIYFALSRLRATFAGAHWLRSACHWAACVLGRRFGRPRISSQVSHSWSKGVSFAIPFSRGGRRLAVKQASRQSLDFHKYNIVNEVIISPRCERRQPEHQTSIIHISGKSRRSKLHLVIAPGRSEVELVV
jgi:hypothetical protein